MERHPRAQLSAYLDGALAPAERAEVNAHLDTCGDCRARLAELRAVASLIGALPALVPSRRLVPRVASGPSWLAPLRTLTTLASGVAVFMFIASALFTNVNTLASGTAALPAAAPAAGGATSAERGVTSPSTAPNQAGAPAADTAKSAATPAPSTTGSQFSISTTPPQDAAARAAQAAPQATRSEVPLISLSPWLWLGIALVLGAIALVLQRRLRSA